MNIPPKYEDVVAQLEISQRHLDRMIGAHDAIQQRLTVAEQRADELEGLLREWRHGRSMTLKDCASLRDRTDAELKPAEDKKPNYQLAPVVDALKEAGFLRN